MGWLGRQVRATDVRVGEVLLDPRGAVLVGRRVRSREVVPGGVRLQVVSLVGEDARWTMEREYPAEQLLRVA